MKRWYVIQSKPRKEELLWEQLLLREINVYYPRIRVARVNPRARKYQSYFPGYMFINVDIEELGISALQWMPGAIGLVNFGQEVASVPESLIFAIRQRIQSIDPDGSEVSDYLKPGDAIRLRSGAFSGYEAIFDSALSGTDRVRVLLKLLHDRQIRVVIPVDQILLAQPS